jgi:3,4-dihydroxyphenylacetate 2,3-dioxygenase
LLGKIVGAALVSHHPGLMQCEEFRVLMGAGADSDLMAGYARLRQRISAAQPDVVMIFDTHCFTTGYHLIDAGARYSATDVSDEMPWYLHSVPYDCAGHPALAQRVEDVAPERGAHSKVIAHPGLGRHCPTINLLKQLRLEDTPVVSVSSCQNCEPHHFLESGAVIGEAIARSGLKVLLLASGALSHRFNSIDWKPHHPRIFHESNVAGEAHIASDKRAIDLLCPGRQDTVIERWDSDYRKLPWEAFGAHYLQMIGAMGGAICTAKGTALSDYEKARGTGNIYIWFDTHCLLTTEH